MARTPLAPIAAALCLLGSGALATPAGTMLFTQAGSQIVDANGVPRPAQRGDVLQQGETLRTPAGGIAQVLMPDGSILGVRADTALRFDFPTSSAPSVVSLLQGSVRVIASELMDARRPSTLTLLSGQATLQLKGGDVETTMVNDKQRSTVDPGSYSRLITGNALIGKGSLVEPLSPLQVSFVGSTNLAPVTLTAISPELFGSKTELGTNSPTPQLATDGGKILAPPPSLVGGNTLTLTAPKTSTLVLAPLPPPPKPVAIISPPIIVQPPKLPVISCKILRTC